MSEKEEVLLLIALAMLRYDPNAQAFAVQGFIARHGPLSEEMGAKVRELLGAKPNEQENR